MALWLQEVEINESDAKNCYDEPEQLRVQLLVMRVHMAAAGAWLTTVVSAYRAIAFNTRFQRHRFSSYHGLAKLTTQFTNTLGPQGLANTNLAPAAASIVIPLNKASLRLA